MKGLENDARVVEHLKKHADISRTLGTKVVPVEGRTKGTMILRCGRCFYKVLKLRSTKDNNYTFEKGKSK